ncbi:hypothetical protein [Plantactinospora sonchi]|uniref:Uncharacterized protein n=1 Tax=Plantactinospora sonchi TaxID=1544735 RepID=A0ABU7RVU4_9ACTN
MGEPARLDKPFEWIFRHRTLVVLVGSLTPKLVEQYRPAATSVVLSSEGYVLSDDGWAHLRKCPAVDSRTEGEGACFSMQRLNNREKLTVWCWININMEKTDVGNYPSTVWFFVTNDVTNASGYVHSSLVHLLRDVPECAGEPEDPRGPAPATLPGVTAPPAMVNSYVDLQDGGPVGDGQNGFEIRLLNFTSNGEVPVTCFLDDQVIGTLVLHTDADGQAFSRDQCTAPAERQVMVQAAEVRSSYQLLSALPQQVRSVTLTRGRPAEAGYYYAIAIKGFPPASEVDGDCHDTVSPDGFRRFTIRTDSKGQGSADAVCRSGDGPEHWVTVSGMKSNIVTWYPPTRQATPRTPPAGDPPTKVATPDTKEPPVEAPPPPRPTATNLVVVLHGGGHVGVAFDVGWQEGRDPVTCHVYIDGRDVDPVQCGTRSSKQFYGLSPGPHRFYAVVTDRYGISSDPTPEVIRTVT